MITKIKIKDENKNLIFLINIFGGKEVSPVNRGSR